MNKTLEISAMQYDFHILTNTNQKKRSIFATAPATLILR